MKIYDREKDILLAFAHNDNSLKKTAQALYMTIPNVHYHIEKIKKRTGLNPRNFFDLGKLLEAVEKEEHNA